jgi:GABA(A) receptor-associated protein
MEKILEKYPDRVPVMVNRKEKSDVPEIERHKYLVPKNMTVGNFIYIIRKHIKLSSDKALFVFIDNKLICNTEMMDTTYNKYKSDDGFLYVIYSGESTFGGLLHIQ